MNVNVCVCMGVRVYVGLSVCARVCARVLLDE